MSSKKIRDDHVKSLNQLLRSEGFLKLLFGRTAFNSFILGF